MTYNEYRVQLEEELAELFESFPRLLRNLSVKDKQSLWEEYNSSVGLPSEFTEDDFDFEIPDIIDWLHDEEYCCDNENLFADWKTKYEENFDKSYKCQVVLDLGKGNEEVNFD